jgi:hypothetical protein
MDGIDSSSRRKSCINEIASKIQDAMKRGDDEGRCFCFFSDIKTIWKERRLNQLLFDNRLSDDQSDFLRERLLRFMSFIVWAEIPDPDWFSTFQSRIFTHPVNANARFTDNNLPLDEDELIDLCLVPYRVRKSLPHQYRFIPATLDFGIQQRTQKIDSHIRLPFKFEAAENKTGGYGLIKVPCLCLCPALDTHWSFSSTVFHPSTLIIECIAMQPGSRMNRMLWQSNPSKRADRTLKGR